MAKIETLSTPPPHWLEDFCYYLQGPNNRPRKQFMTSTHFCSDFSLWLNLFELEAGTPAPTNIGDAISVALPPPAGSNHNFKVESKAISYEKPLDLQTALEMALLASANPAMQGKKGVKLYGSEQDVALLHLACTLAGVAVDKKVKVDKKILKAADAPMKAQWAKMQGDLNTEATTLVAKKEAEVYANVIKNKVDTTTKAHLGSFCEIMYGDMKEQVWKDQSVSAAKLMSDFSVSATEAGQVLDAMEEEKLIHKDATTGAYDVSINKSSQWNVS